MGLSQSLYTGLSGLITHNTALSNTSNNLANVNTTGYKNSEFQFSNIFKQAIVGSLPATGDKGATNPKNVGLGVTTGAIQNNFSEGTVEFTGNSLDCAISGSNGFFVVATRTGTALTRNGSFYRSTDGTLSVGNGLAVQGWNAVNGSVTPSSTVENIVIPGINSTLDGVATQNVTVGGILSTQIADKDLAGNATTYMDLKGNLGSGENSLLTSVFVDVTTTNPDGTQSTSVQEVPVRLDFTGPTVNADGNNEYTWTMNTVDWPNTGDSQQIYPTADDPNFSRGTISFYGTSTPSAGQAAGQCINDTVSPGSSSVSFTDDDGVTSSFRLPTSFGVDVSRLTNLADAPGGNSLETWYVNGNPTGTMASTITTFDEYTDFVSTTNAAGNTVMEAVRRVEERQSAIYFAKADATSEGTVWEWTDSRGGSGELFFDIHGDMVPDKSSSTSGDLVYDFESLQYLNSETSVAVSGLDGHRNCVLTNYNIDGNGVIWGIYTNNVTEPLAQIALGSVANPTGLAGSSGTLFHTTDASGGLMIGVAGDATNDYGLYPIGAGSIVGSSLESSNVNMSRELTNLISIERGYQLNSRIVTISNEMLQTALQLK